MNDNKIMNKAADNIRILAASMVEKAKSGHPGGAMGGADFINTLYSEFLVYDPENPAWEGRDRFFLDPGHMVLTPTYHVFEMYTPFQEATFLPLDLESETVQCSKEYFPRCGSKVCSSCRSLCSTSTHSTTQRFPGVR